MTNRYETSYISFLIARLVAMAIIGALMFKGIGGFVYINDPIQQQANRSFAHLFNK